MAHYAFVNDENVVVEVIVGRDEQDVEPGIESWETYYGSKRPGLRCLRTSYNTRRDENGRSIHLTNGTPFRGQYAGIGDLYDSQRDEFYTPTPWLNDFLTLEESNA